MYDNLSKEYINEAINDLIGILGVKEKIPKENLINSIYKRKPKQCVEEIASYLGLPIKISLSSVPKNYAPGSQNKFKTRQLSKTNGYGKGVGSIVAQVAIPENIPSYGSPKLDGYLISVRVSENYFEEPETFITLMAHELSHVLLKTIWHPMKDNEFYTDLVPIILGFGKIIDAGRKIETPESITTFGYLTDKQYNYIREKVEQILDDCENDKSMLLERVSEIKKQTEKLKNRLSLFDRFTKDTFKHSKRKMAEKDSFKIVQFYAQDHSFNIEAAIKKANAKMDEVENTYKNIMHYTVKVKEKMEKDKKALDSIFHELQKNFQSIEEALNILRKNMSITYKIKKYFNSKLFVK